MKQMWPVAVMMGAISTVCFLLGCEESDHGEAVPISGNSVLVIDNRTNEDFDIYCDSQYIGKVKDHKQGRWSVPSGMHKIAAESDGEDLKATFIFYDGKETVVRIGFKGLFNY